MIRLGFRLTVNGGKEAAVRLVITCAAVALGVGLLLVALAGMNAINTQNGRTAWLNTVGFEPGPGQQAPVSSNPAAGLGGKGPVSPPASVNPAPSSSSALVWVSITTDNFQGRTIDRIDLAATGPHSPLPPGISKLPGPGQFYASPALTRLLDSTPAAELGERFPGMEIGTIGSAALPSPNSLIIIVGRTAAEVSRTPGATQVSAFETSVAHTGGRVGWDSNRLQIILAIGVLALLFPVLIFIATATRLSAARREQRFAAMRLVGATPRQISVIAAIEACVAAFGGVVAGFVLFFLFRPVIANVPFTGQPFAAGDLSLSLPDVILVAVGVPIAAAAAARVALRRVVISPLGVSRRVTPPAPRAYRLVPLVAGIAELTYFVEVGRPKTTGGQIDAYFSGCLLIMVGLVFAGPWLTMVGSRLMARRTSRPAVLIAGRRLSDNPRAAFRAITGLILALFIGSVSVGIISTILDYKGTAGGAFVAGATLVDGFGGGPGPQPFSADGQAPDLVSGRLLTELNAIAHVNGVTVVRTRPDSQQTPGSANSVLASCAQIARTPSIGRCAAGATIAAITGNLDDAATSKSPLASKVWPDAGVSLRALASFPVGELVVQTDGSAVAIERARTALERALPAEGPPETFGEINAVNNRSINELQQLTNVVIIVSLVIAGCSLAVSATSAVTDRKRPFSLLRLTGVPIRTLRRVVALETAVPLLIIAVLSAGMGFLAADLFLRSQLAESLRAPGVQYYAVVAAGLIACLAIIASTLPLIERITGPEVSRNE